MLRQFRVVFNAVRTHFQQVEKKVGIGGAQVWALSVIRRTPGAGVNSLAQAMNIHQSTASNLVRQLATALGQPARLWPVPLAGLQLAARLTGRQAAVQRLCSSLQVDISATCQGLQWAPPVSVAEGLRRMVADMDGTP